MSDAITPAQLKSFAQQFADDTTYTVAQRAVTSNGIHASSENNALSATNTTVFSVEVETGSVSDQKNSGRCWLYATLNTVRHQIATDFKLDDLELSQSYLYFWDKLEKSNVFYEDIIDSAGKPLDDRWVEYVLSDPQADGGWWHYAASLMTKYGIVPQSVMPEAAATSDSRQLNNALNRKLRKDALVLRQLVNDKTPVAKIAETKENMLSDVYRILTVAIGTPPTSFDFIYKDKDKKFHRELAITPLEFLKKYYKHDPADYVALVNDPTPTKKYLQLYQFDQDKGNVIGGILPTLLNVDMATIKTLTHAQLEKGESVWFGCDVMVDINKKGFMSLDTYDLNATLGVDISLQKAERLQTRDTSVNHAMTIAGVDVVDGATRQWKVENSWGDDQGLKGYYTMSDEWFDKNGYVVVIKRNLLPKELLEALEKPAVMIPLWDPLNSLPQ